MKHEDETAQPAPVGQVERGVGRHFLENDMTDAEIETLKELLTDALDSNDWCMRRLNALQEAQGRMRDPERTMVCDILANGSLLLNGKGKLAEERYSMPPNAKLTGDRGVPRASGAALG